MSDQIEYKIEETCDGAFILSGPIIDSRPRFASREAALSFARYAIGAREGGGFIKVVNADGNTTRDFFQGSRHLTNDGAFQR